MANKAHCAYAFDCLVSHIKEKKEHSLDEFTKVLKIPQNEQTTFAPLFITYNTIIKNHSQLRGCIGTFVQKNLKTGIKEYSLFAGLKDHRFDPISIKELPTLECCVTILTDFENAKNALDWEIGLNGIKISFIYKKRDYGATFLPDVPKEQGWTKSETISHLVSKAGYPGNPNDWHNLDISLVKYKGSKASCSYKDYINILGLLSN